MLKTPWFRSFHGMPMDNRLKLVASKAGTETARVLATWWAMLNFASQQEERGSVREFDVETFAHFADIPEETVNAVVEGLVAKKFVIDGRIANWDRDQPLDDPTARARKRRQRAKEQALATDEGDWTLSGNQDCDLDFK